MSELPNDLDDDSVYDLHGFGAPVHLPTVDTGEYHAELTRSQQQYTQLELRLADAERARDAALRDNTALTAQFVTWRDALQGLTPKGSEFTAAYECVLWLSNRFNYPQEVIRLRNHVKQVEGERDALQTNIAAVISNRDDAMELAAGRIAELEAQLREKPVTLETQLDGISIAAHIRILTSERDAAVRYRDEYEAQLTAERDRREGYENSYKHVCDERDAAQARLQQARANNAAIQAHRTLFADRDAAMIVAIAAERDSLKVQLQQAHTDNVALRSALYERDALQARITAIRDAGQEAK
jgi:hypothetical protein